MFNYRVVAIINPPERGQPAYLCLMWGGKTIVVNHTGSIAPGEAPHRAAGWRPGSTCLASAVRKSE